MKKYLNFLYGLALALAASSCSEDFIGQYATDGVAPSSISADKVNVVPMPGGAKIAFQLPDEPDLSYVKGVFKVKGVEHIVRTSIYTDTLKVEGLGSTEPLKMQLYVVDHSENVSAPCEVEFTPGTPIIELILNSLKLQADFGGVNVKWKNVLKTEVGITIMATNDDGEMEEGETYFNQLGEGSYSFRGYDDTPRTFSVYVTDKWGNVSERTEGVELTPIYEALLDRTKFKRGNLTADNYTEYGSKYSWEKMFDNNTTTFWESAQTVTAPFYFTIDLGSVCKLSRFKMYPRPTTYVYKHGNVKLFEVWGTAVDKKNEVHDLAYWGNDWKNDPDWELLGDYKVYKPSGDNSTITSEDQDYAKQGFEFDVPIDAKPARYLRIHHKANWSGSVFVDIAEMMFWGNDKMN